jgi:hypothetical protein
MNVIAMRCGSKSGEPQPAQLPACSGSGHRAGDLEGREVSAPRRKNCRGHGQVGFLIVSVTGVDLLTTACAAGTWVTILPRSGSFGPLAT